MLEVLEECIWDENSQLFQMRGFWNSGVKVKSRILEELEAYWTRLALQGRSLEEASRWQITGMCSKMLQGSLFG